MKNEKEKNKMKNVNPMKIRGGFVSDFDDDRF